MDRDEPKNEPKIGKIDLDTFQSFLLRRLGKKDDSVIVPPLTGVDSAVIDVGSGNVLIIAEDPIFAMPGQPFEMFGWYTVHIGVIRAPSLLQLPPGQMNAAGEDARMFSRCR